ncbi:MAG: hypothetical protein AAF081_06200 [Actinomycetota bacterium]
MRDLLAGAARLRAALDRFEARVAARLGEASAVRGATRCTQREADRAVARGELLAAVPRLDAALATGEVSGAHVDVMARAAERTSVEAVASSGLVRVAKSKPADAMRREVDDFIRREADDTELQRRLERQRARRRCSMRSADMGVLHVECDDVTFAEIRAAVDAETDRLWRLDGGRDGAEQTRTPEQRRADAVASLILGGGVRDDSGPVRHQMVIVAQTDGTGAIPGVGPLPEAEVERLACISDLYGIVFDGNGRALWHGDRVRLADDNQLRALIARDRGCIACGAHPSRCEAHHVRFRRHHGPTDIENLVLVCKHHHHLIHDKNWHVHRDPSGGWTLAPP